MEKNNHGKSGRPRTFPDGVKRVSICLPPELCADLRALGGSGWIREKILEAKDEVARARNRVAKAEERKARELATLEAVAVEQERKTFLAEKAESKKGGFPALRRAAAMAKAAQEGKK